MIWPVLLSINISVLHQLKKSTKGLYFLVFCDSKNIHIYSSLKGVGNKPSPLIQEGLYNDAVHGNGGF